MDIKRAPKPALSNGQTLVEYVMILAAMVFLGAAAGVIGHQGRKLVDDASAPLQGTVAPAAAGSYSAASGSISVDLSASHNREE